MGKILGEVVIRSNGKQLKTKKGSTLNPGGYTLTLMLGLVEFGVTLKSLLHQQSQL
ncbi:phage tail tube protein [Enterovibrio nigricans]|uniref:Phage tail tube protein n=1 Tax=Enterovibrio nigricans DSM 22720 TaxID=1121868 RepID=A0A1T4VWJ5_9GAMM|nr:phage tail tube protein [Enterovibrio nigricans]SKA69366.1 Phage tail tube protein [Enterovibrio nigricans DSM 22720]